MIQRRTQTAAYWLEQFAPSDRDVAFLYELILDRAQPIAMSALAQALMERHCRREEDDILAELSRGALYQPREEYRLGDMLVFPALSYALGTVRGTRPGRNPDYGEFVVIQVQMEQGGRVREFASGLTGEHALNRGEGERDLLSAPDLRPVSELYASYGSHVQGKLSDVLSQGDVFVNVRGEWFIRDMLLRINVGQLNIAEALIEIKGMPLPTAEFLPDMDLPMEVSEDIQILSLNHALESDGRFDNVGDSGRDIWYLRRLTPDPVVNTPHRLKMDVIPYNREHILNDLLAIEKTIDDEGSGEEVFGSTRPIYRTVIALTYPHWRCGTLPLTVRTRGLFPQALTHHSPVVLMDGQSGEKLQGWIVHGGAFVYGLKDWLTQHDLPVGTYLRLERTRDPRVITVDFERQRLKRLWIRVATVEGGRLTFQMRKLPVACKYDELLAIGEDHEPEIDRLWTEANARGDSLLQLVVHLMPELIKLSPQGTVHAKTIYSSVNILRRVPPGPVFALLSTEPCLIPMGGGYWSFDEALVES